MAAPEEEVRRAGDAPALPTVAAPTDEVARAAARLLARRHCPTWRPTDAELDAFGAGYGLGVRHRLEQDAANHVELGIAPLVDWPPVTPPGGGA